MIQYNCNFEGGLNMIIRESYLQRIRPFYYVDLIKVITEIRRCGKSVILMQIIDELKKQGISEDNIIYINFEDYDYSFIKTADDLHKYIKEKIVEGKKYYLFFDEIQTIYEFEKVINSLRLKFGCSISITGSNGKLLSGELATYLSGRYVSFRIYPLSFSEVCTIKHIERQQITDDLLVEYMTWGGLPQRFLFQDVK